MSLSQLSGKQGINYAKLRHKKSPNDQQSFGLFEDMNRNNLQYIESLIQKRKPSVDLKHQRAKSTLDNKQHSYRHGTPINDMEELEGEKLFDQFFKLNNSRSDSDFMKESIQRDSVNKNNESDFLKFVENAIEYHKHSDVRFFRLSVNKQSQLEQKLKETTLSNRLLANQLNQYKQKEIDLKSKIKMMQKEFTIQYQKLVQQNAWLEELLAKQKIDNQNSLLAVKKTVEMLQIKCKCQKGNQLCDKILRDVKNQERVRQQYEWEDESKPTHSSSELSNNTQEEELEDSTDFNYQLYDKNRRKSISKVCHNSIQSSEEQQEQLVQSFINGKSKNLREFPKDMFLRKKQTPDPYYIEEENTINSN
ncbi:unnamed protein product (macronuclear) [Paramecium tetraurelia]|uniref:Uncharacterized protein n=1 Tax=Paramecium tetraurelia TaxID=5888 RepID=A0CLC9_PARTE|nr:uncharacterized protein GSPATT00008144001 [Paramecium tetraurelia]CAK71596.1 unnamed protein product [Paramecium tetraurelia]|eukprot:XP_001438993.1 hypothetical protein (macronuclear) [Paramecium tetraurelia strain d4-2]